MDFYKQLKKHQFNQEELDIISTLKTGKYMEKEINGEKFYVNKSKWFYKYDDVYEYHKFSGTKLKRNKTFTPPNIKDLGFNDLQDFKDFVFNEGSKILNTTPQRLKNELDKPNKSQTLMNIGKLWEKNLDVDELYGNDEYLMETIHCGIHVSSSINKQGFPEINKCLYKLLLTLYQMGYVHRDRKGESFHLIDFGSGMGMTTLFLAQLLPNSTIYYNELNKKSRELFSSLLKKSGLTNVKMIEEEEWDKLPPLDFIVGIEFFEHIPHPENSKIGSPMLVVDEWLSRMKKDGVLLMNTYWDDSNQDIPSLGHFEDYVFDDNEMVKRWSKGKSSPQKMFDKNMKNRGFQRLDGVYWDWFNHGVSCYISDEVKYSNLPSGFFK